MFVIGLIESWNRQPQSSSWVILPVSLFLGSSHLTIIAIVIIFVVILLA